MKIIRLALFIIPLNGSRLFNQKKSLMARDIGKLVCFKRPSRDKRQEIEVMFKKLNGVIFFQRKSFHDT